MKGQVPIQDTRLAILGGTGLGTRLKERLDPPSVEQHDVETPFGTPSDTITTGRLGELDVALLARHGNAHQFNPTRVPYRANIFALKSLGCTHLVASGATGSLRESIAPGDLVSCDQLIDRTIHRPRTFYDHAAVHVELADPCCPVLRNWLHDAAASSKTTFHDSATYLCMEGPAFSTRAESNMHRLAGADLIGMTAMPEARLAREAELAYALVALPTDWDCWRDTSEDSILDNVIANLQKASEAALDLLERACMNPQLLRIEPSPAHRALDKAIFSDPACIDADQRKRLSVLWGRVLQS